MRLLNWRKAKESNKKKEDPDVLKAKLEEKEGIRQVTVQQRLCKKEHKVKEKMQFRAIKEKRGAINFFTKWFFIGIILVLLSICVGQFSQVLSNDGTNNFYIGLLNILSALLSALGIALFVGCVFDFSKNSDAFITFVSRILSDIVVSKDFLSTLSVKDKEQALNLILKPMDSQVEQYANINAFYEKKIKEVMTMFDANFKTNVNLNIEARVDDKKDCVYCCTTLTYSIYKLDNKYKPIRVIFEKKGSTSSDVEIICPATVNTIPAGCPERISDGGIEYERYTFEIPIECEKYDHLMVRRKMTEPGNREWINYYWQSVTPYENVTFSLKCFDGLRIEDYMIFDNKAYYHVDLSDDKTKLDITSSEWLDADTGFCVFITK